MPLWPRQCHVIIRCYCLLSCFLLCLVRSTVAFSVKACNGRVSITKNRNMNDKEMIINYHVIGTSHFRCESYKEVSSLIHEVKPDGVVIELDPERTLKLTLDDAIKRQNIDRWFGADFLSAIETCKSLDIPIFLGDEYPIETKTRFMDTLIDSNSYRPDNLLSAMTSLVVRRYHRQRHNILFVDVIGTFLDDPKKLLPIMSTLILPFLVFVVTTFIDKSTTISSVTHASISSSAINININDLLITILSLISSFIVSCKVYNNLIADRDEVMASNAQRTAETIAMLKSNELIRKQWQFPVNVKEMNDENQPVKTATSMMALFTLKTPLERNDVRNLNLFEPRWLKMIDRVQQQDQSTKENKPVGSGNDTASSCARTIGCVSCTNKFYSAVNIAATEEPLSFTEGRYADVIFRRRGRFGEISSVREGTRPSGARKVSTNIIGKESFYLPSSKEIFVASDGYLMASNLQPIDDGHQEVNIISDSDREYNDVNTVKGGDIINIVIVCGLLHANGILEHLSEEYMS